jgi:hypothetical protein
VIVVRKLNYDYVKEFVENNSNCKLLSNDYLNNKQKLLFLCKCGKQFSTTFGKFKDRGKRQCNKCSGLTFLSYSELKIYVESNSDCKLISNSYANCEEMLLFECNCGTKFQTSYLRFKFQNKRQCNKCGIKKMSGPNNPQYKPALTEEYRNSRRRTKNDDKFRKEVFERDNYTCQCCGIRGNKLNAHHLNGFHWFEAGRFDPNNGITLCNKCHTEFHVMYGNVNNTIGQYISFSKLFNTQTS